MKPCLSIVIPAYNECRGETTGETAALKTGIEHTIGGIVVIQDADLEYDREDIPNLIQPIAEGYADVVYGSRFLIRKAARVLYFYHYVPIGL